MTGAANLKPLRLALVHRASPRMIDRMFGWFSYEVPEFTWEHFPVRKGFRFDKDKIAGRADVIIYEDAKINGDFIGRADIPICYVIVDSTLSETHYRHRLREAKKADLLLVDWDRLIRFQETGKPAIRFSYCVNDRLFCPGNFAAPRPVDIAMHHNRTPERERLNYWGDMFSKGHGLNFACGVKFGPAYAEAFRRAKVVINVHRNDQTRSHRMFDVMASGACLITSRTPYVSGEEREPGVHYLQFDDLDHLATVTRRALYGERWKEVGMAGYELVKRAHTWKVRAGQLRQDIYNQLGV